VKLPQVTGVDAQYAYREILDDGAVWACVGLLARGNVATAVTARDYDPVTGIATLAPVIGAALARP
jgi:hypothetical protein